MARQTDSRRGEFTRLYMSLLLSDRTGDKLIAAALFREQSPELADLAKSLEDSAYAGLARDARRH